MASSNPGAANHTPTGRSQGIQGIVLYPEEPYLILASVLLVVGCFQWGSFFHFKFTSRRRFIRDEESIPASRRGRSILSLPLAVVNFYRTIAFRTTIGIGSYIFNLAEVFVTLAYIALLLVWTFIISSDPDGEPLNWCSRAGLLAASQFPFITILGTKNNIVSLITGIGPDKLNYLHRLAARACLTLVGIHALGGVNNFSFYGSASNESQLFGIVAALTFAGLAVVSLRPVRERAYEFFFYLHFIAIIVIMLATIIHITEFSGTNFTLYIWPSFIIWALDRLIRTARLVFFNLAYFGFGKKSGTLDATTELLSENLVRVRFRRPSSFHWSPGQFAYLIMPSVSRLPFEAHPFSISSVDSALFAPEETVVGGGPGSPYRKELVFLIGVRGGFTKRLKEVAERRESVKVYVDGPYGDVVNLGCYDTSLLIAGGTGITYALPTFLNIIESVRNGSSCCRRIVLIWSIRDSDFLRWVEEALTKANKFVPPGLKVVIRVFLTSGRPPQAAAPLPNPFASETSLSNPFENQNPFQDPANSFDKQEGLIFSAPWLEIVSGRPNLHGILEDEIHAATGRVSVSVCGPNAMARVVRKALRFPWSSPASPLNGGPTVTLHVESFGYA
ncbi:hypothetical protein PAXRUDRAFT_828115 [Paxillus rubicundulus Ve08.2h10]|uniref:ferric-chelate reductase (NADPH) n=1 Tax=Paxillus rubicundulus Ve08.2h10 TaxID=930991 RepID=A0A0D0DB17_9AGAM|nr:hypothetical protein PAXRUDRAFT_828115 [Paxillus rubicundulus Ve08.2h10]